MKMTQETDVLKGENADLVAILQEMLGAVHEADVETARWGPAHLFVHVPLVGGSALE